VRSLSLGLSIALALIVAVDAAGGAGAKTVKIDASAAPWIVVGNRVAVHGTVTPHPAGIELVVQQRHGSGWRAVGVPKVAADGRFAFVLRPDHVGLTTYRVVTADGSDAVGASARVPVRVLHWVYLDSIDEFAYINPLVGGFSKGAMTASGVHYDHAVSLDPGCYNAWGGSAWIDYPLQRRYETFTASIGLGGAATAGSTATYTILGGDGKQLGSGSLTFGGPPQKIRASVSGEYRLRLRINVPDPTHAGACSSSYTQVIFGDAELLGP
jgi:hypothetical protein